MTEEEEGLKSFMENYFDFDALKEAGFYNKGIKLNDYKKQAERICYFFGLDSVFDYMMIGHGVGCHISEVASIFKCPVCTCEQEVPGSKKMIYNIECAGCKRKLEVSPSGWSNYLITDVGGKESTVTYSKNSFIYKQL